MLKFEKFPVPEKFDRRKRNWEFESALLYMKTKQEVAGVSCRCWRFKPTSCVTEIKISRSPDHKVNSLYGRKLLILCNHSVRYCGSGDKRFLIFHATSCDHVLKGLCDLMS